jgi:two-component system sensor histidine kinase/response regulator
VPLWLEFSLAPVFDRHGHIDRFIAVQIDTTERRNHELAMRQQQAELENRVQRRTAQLAAAKELAEQATSAKSSFVSTMSHEIRTPLNAIVGFTALLMSTDLTEQQRTYAEKTERSVALLLGLVNDVLDFSKIEAGAMTLANEPFDVRAIFDSVDAVLGSSARSKGLAFAITLDDDVPAIVVGDRLRLSEVVLNLVSNAVKFTQLGSVTVQLGVVASDEEEITLLCSVVDTGIGIATNELPALF